MKQLIVMMALISTGTLFSQNANHACSNLKIQQFEASFANKSSKLSSVGNYDEKFVKLELDVSSTSKFISGKCSHLVKVETSSMNEFVFELVDVLIVSAVSVNGANANFTHVSDELTISSPVTHNRNDLVNIEIDYSGTAPDGNGFNSPTGLFNEVSPTWKTRVTWTLSEPYVAKTWWPCKQVLTDKIDSTLFIFTTEDSLKVGSNGLLIKEEVLVGNKKRYTWKSNYPIDYYLISFACAPYQEYSYKVLPTGAADSLLIQNYIYKDVDYIPLFENDILETGDMLLHFSEKFGEYPFIKEKYGHCLAPLGGGMEHQTMTTQGYFTNWLTAHELGHQWWGDNVTCSTWNDIWLNEGFASYSEYIYYQEFTSQAEADDDMLDRHNDIMGQSGGSVYVTDISDPNRIFSNRLTYNKGSAVVHMMRNYINNDSLFFHTLKVYQETFKNSTTSTQDLKDLILQETAIDFTEFFDSWIFGEGFPIYSGIFNNQNDTVFVRVDQTSSLVNYPIVYPSILDIELFYLDGTSEIKQVRNDFNFQGYYFLSTMEVESISLDPDNWIINQEEEFIKDESFSFSVISTIAELENDLIAIENPFQESIRIKLKEVYNIESISVVNSFGTTVFEMNGLFTNDYSINSSQWSKGIYLITLTSNKREQTIKLLKN
jgi:aminopeptidase N